MTRTRLFRSAMAAGALALAAASSHTEAFARRGDEGTLRVTNQVVRIEGDVALISYDLDIPEGTTMVVTIELRREGDPAFTLVPANVTGDVGEIKGGGPHRLIRWEFLRDFPIALHGEDYYFKIDASRPGSFPWVWVGIGSAAVAGTVAILSHKSSSGAAQPGTQELPMPPPR